MKHALAVIAAALILFVALARVGKETAAAADGPTIEFWTYAGGGSTGRSTRFWTAVARGFEERRPGVTVRTVTDINHGNYEQMIGTRFIGGNPPDVMIMDDLDVVPLNIEKLLMPLEPLIESDPDYHTEDFPSSMVCDGYVGNTRYSIPWYGGFPCLFYRTDLLDQAGVEPPGSWQELVDVSKRLQQELGMQYPFAMDPSVPFYAMSWIWQNGGLIVSPDHRRVTVDSQEAVGAIRFLHELVHRHRIVDPGIAGGTRVDVPWSSGKAAIKLDGAWNIGTQDDNFPQWEGKWSVVPLPAGQVATSFYGGQHLVMNRDCRYPEVAWKFMVWATSPEMQRLWTEITGSPPANLRAFDDAGFRERNPHFTRMKEAMVTGRNVPMAPFFDELWYGRFDNGVMDVVMQDPDADIQGAITETATVMQTITDRYWERHAHFVQGCGNL